MVLLLHSGRCYEAEIYVILFLLRCPFIWYPFWPKSKFSDFGQKPWTIIRRFDRNRAHCLRSFYSSLEGAMNLKFSPPAPLQMYFSLVSFLAKAKISVSGRKPWTIITKTNKPLYSSHQLMSSVKSEANPPTCSTMLLLVQVTL